MEVTESGFPFENGDVVCLCSYPDKPNIRNDNTGWNLCVANGQVVHNGGRGQRAQWQVVRHPDGKVSFRTRVGDGRKNLAGNDLGWHLGIKEDGTVVPNAGLGPFGKFTPIPIPVTPQPNHVEGEQAPKNEVKWCFMCQAHEEKKNRGGGKGWHIGVTPAGEVIGNAGRGELGQFTVAGMTEKAAVKQVQVPKEQAKQGIVKNPRLAKDKPFKSFDPTKVYYINRVPTQHVRAVVTLKKQLYKPAKHWVVYAPIPPQDLPCQHVNAASLKLSPQPGAPDALIGQPVNLSHPMFFIHAKGDHWPVLRKQAHFEFTIDAQLYFRRLKEMDPSTNPADIPPPQDITPDEAKLFLRQTSLVDYNTSAFQRWLDEKGLRPNNEHALGFALRAFHFVRSTFKYSFSNEMDRRASKVIRAGSTDCGGFGILFSAIMRPNGIPTRLLFGRWAASKKPGSSYTQIHVKCEFFIKGIGWIPVDVASAILNDKSPEKMQFFGKDNGDFVVFHVEHDVVLDTCYYGRTTELCLQGFAFWTCEEGRGDGPTENDWKVTKVE